DVVTRDSYTDVTALSPLPGQAQALEDNLKLLRQAESRVARVELQIADLLARIDVAQNNQRYIAEKDTLTATLQSLASQKPGLESQRAALLADRYNYWCYIRAKHSGMLAWVGNASFDWLTFQEQYTWGDERPVLFCFEPLGNDHYRIFCRAYEGHAIAAMDNGLLR